MIDRLKYDRLKSKYGKCSSWAIWADQGERPKSNTSDLSIFDSDDVVNELNSDYVFVGLNVSRDDCKEDWSNFHSPSPFQNDYKLRYAFKGTPFWGSYMTDVIKRYPEPDSRTIESMLKSGIIDVEKNIGWLKEELDLLGKPTIIAFGNAVHQLLTEQLSGYGDIIKLNHYSIRCSKERYRAHVHEAIRDVLNIGH